MTSWRMRPTTSALGVIAIISVMITATNSEPESGAIEHGINHPVVDQEDRHFQENERTANETSKTDNIYARASNSRKNDTANEVTIEKELFYLPTYHQDITNLSHVSIDILDPNIAELQRDQSDIAASTPLNDPRVTRHSLIGSDERISELDSSKSKMLETTIDFEATTLPTQGEYTSRNVLEPWTSTSRKIEGSYGLRVDDTPSNVLHEEDGQTDDVKAKQYNLDPYSTTMTSFQDSVVTESKQIEQKNVDDIRAISFQVPPPRAEGVDEQEAHRQRGIVKNDEARKLAETRKDHSRPVNNLLLGSGKSTKAFYEIKPSIKTEMEKGYDQQIPTSTQKALSGRKFILPSVDSAFGKFGPYFEDGDQEMNITARIGSTVLLDCKIGMLGDKKVTWLQHSKDSFRLLTVGRTPYSVDQRISLNFRYPSNWRLQILYASPRDSGLYKCQVATHPPLVKKINVIVTAPELTITDDSGRVVSKERHLKAGSALKLRCEARDVVESLEESVVWTRGDETLTEDVSENRTTEISAGKEVLVIVSTLIVERATPRHAGNYSCVVPGKAKTTIAVHVLNGELPAAVHDGNGVSRVFLNLWLIHLTMSYVFSR